jgi:hypothetical protein
MGNGIVNCICANMFSKFIPECELNTTEVFPGLLRLADPSVRPWNCNPCF